MGRRTGYALEKMRVFIRGLTCAENVSIHSVCSGSSEGQDHNPVWTLSGTTMKAYVAMRGLPAIEDPLMTWIATLEMGKRVEGKVTYVPLPPIIDFASAG